MNQILKPVICVMTLAVLLVAADFSEKNKNSTTLYNHTTSYRLNGKR